MKVAVAVMLEYEGGTRKATKISLGIEECLEGGSRYSQVKVSVFEPVIYLETAEEAEEDVIPTSSILLNIAGFPCLTGRELTMSTLGHAHLMLMLFYVA